MSAWLVNPWLIFGFGIIVGGLGMMFVSCFCYYARDVDFLGYNWGLEKAARLFDQQEIDCYNAGATWDTSRIVEGSKYCMPTNGPAIACVAAEIKAREIRALKVQEW